MVSASRLRGQNAKAVPLSGFIIDKGLKVPFNSLAMEGFEYPVSCVQEDVEAPKSVEKNTVD